MSPAPPQSDCRTCRGSGEDAYGQRCVCTYNKDRAARSIPTTCIETIDGDPDTALRLSFQIKVF